MTTDDRLPATPHRKACIIIPAHNGARFLSRCLRAVQAQVGVAFDTIVVDNGSSDQGADLVAAEFPQVQLVREPQALGFSGAVNRGLRLALEGDGELLVILNQDTEVAPGWLAALAAALEQDRQLGVVGCLAVFPGGRVQHAGGELLLPLGYGRNIGYGLAPEGPLPDTPLDFISGVAMGLRRSMLARIGLFDEGFNPGYFEDVDLSLRAVAAGWTLALVPEARLVHHEGAAGAAGDYDHAALIERNRLRLRLKHASIAELTSSFFPAEANHLRERARGGSAHVLRRAYLEALLMLPGLRRPAPEAAVIRAALVALRREASALEWSGDKGARRPGDSASTRSFARPHPVSGSRGHPASPAASLPAAPPPVAIIMLTWNGLHYTKECLESLRAITAGVAYRVIVVDNGSTDGTREYLRTLDWVELIENETNLGYVRGNNQGIAASPAGWDVLLLNNDMRILHADWLARLRETAHADVSHGVVGARLLMTDGKLLHAGTYMPTGTFWGWQVGGGEVEIGQYRRVREVDGVVGACMYLRRDVIDAVGVLDTRFFSYYEDTDYCLRVQEAGYKIVVDGEVTLVHYENVSTKLNRVDFWSIFGPSQAVFLAKWERHYQERYRHRLLWHSIVSAPTGYAMSTRGHLLALDRKHVDLRLAYLYGPDINEKSSGDPRIEQLRNRPKDTSLVQVVYHQGDVFHKNSGRYKIGYTMLEVTGIPDDWVAQSNLMDEVWVPSTFNAQTFRDSGVTRPIHVIPLGIDPDYLHPRIKSRRFSERYTFLSVFEWGERKAPELLLKAYAAAFTAKDDVVLVLKVDNRDGDVNVAQQIAALNLPQSAPRIVVLYNHEVPAYQLGGLYRGADCFVIATRGEGWGMPILEAMACGLPAIATRWSAQTDFMHDEYCYPVAVRRLIPAVAKCPYYAGFAWAEPDVEQLAHQMRYVYEHREAAAAVGARAADYVAREWTWDRAAEKIIARLEAIGA